MNEIKRRPRLGLLAVSLLLCPMTASAQPGTFAKPGLVTSVGQSSDIAIVKALLNTKLKMDLEVKPLAQAGDLANARTLILVVGSSTKGLGAAGLNVEQEMARTRSLLKAARDGRIRILTLHVGGEARRGKTTNDFLDVVVPQSSRVIVVAAGNKDRFFNTLAAKSGVPIAEAASLAAAGDAVKSLFQQ